MGLAKPHWLSIYNREKRVQEYFVTYTHFFIVSCDLHTLFKKSLGLNNVTYIFPKVIQVEPLGWELSTYSCILLTEFWLHHVLGK